MGETSPDAFDPARDFTVTRRGPLEIYAWKGSLAAGRVDSIAAARLEALKDIAALVGVEPPARVRLVFYPDGATKLRQTGHQGVGWAFGHTLVEVYNDSVRLDSYHELTHIVAAAAGSPPPALGEGLAVYVTEQLGGDALAFLNAPGKSVDQAVCALEGTPRLIPSKSSSLWTTSARAPSAPPASTRVGSSVKYLVEAQGLDRTQAAYRTSTPTRRRPGTGAASPSGRDGDRCRPGSVAARARGACEAGRPASGSPERRGRRRTDRTPAPERPMFSRSAELYDQIYGRIEDYADESRRVAELSASPYRRRTLLDVGCGTGEHGRLRRGTTTTTSTAWMSGRTSCAWRGASTPDRTFTRGTWRLRPGEEVRRRALPVQLHRDVRTLRTSSGRSAGFARTWPAAGGRARALDRAGRVAHRPGLPPHGRVRGGDGVPAGSLRATRAALDAGVPLPCRPERGIEHMTETHELGLFTRRSWSAASKRPG